MPMPQMPSDGLDLGKLIKKQLLSSLAEQRERDHMLQRASVNAEQQAEQSSEMACKIYFSAIKNSNLYCDTRLRRKIGGFGVAEAAHEVKHQARKHNAQRASDALMSASTALRAYAPRQHDDICEAGGEKDGIGPMAAHYAVSYTLSSMGIANRVDSTRHEGYTYWDVVI